MNEEEKFDELLRSKLSEREFPLDDVNWDEAERLIVTKERWRKISRYSLIFSAGLLAGVFTMLPFILNTHTTPPGNVVSESKTSQSIISKNISQLPANPPAENPSIQNNKKPSNPLPPSIAKNIDNSGKHSILSSPSPIPKTSNEQPSSISKEATIPTLSNQPDTTDLIASARHIDKVSEHKETTKLDKTNHTEEALVKNEASTPNSNPTENLSNHKDTTNSSANTVVKTNKTSKINKDKVKKPSTNIPPAAKSVTYIKTPKDSNKVNNPPLLRVTPPMLDTGKFTSNILSVYAGIGYSPGWSNNGSNEANGVTPWGGFAFSHYFSGKISASIGIGYSELNNLNKTYTNSTIQYDFGANTHIITVTPQLVYYLAIPVNIHYNFDDKNKISAGFNYFIMMTTRSTLSSYQQTYFGKTFINSQTENGYTQGFSNYDLQLTLSYTRMLGKRMGLGIEAYLGLVSVENSSFPGITQYGKNKGGRLILSYELFK